MPSRRTTLGPIAVNNRRISTGTSGRTAKQRMSIAAPRVSSSVDDAPHNNSNNSNYEAVTVSNTPAISGTSRRSLANGLSNSNSENRRMSTLPPMASGMRADPRPINDKAYMNACIKNLTQYLLSNGYDQAVSTKSLARPSATEFTNIITYLLRKIDPTFHSFGSKFEDEVAQTFKRIGYPLNVSKTALAAVGSPHTWPALLSALTWLIELLNCDEATPKEEDWKNTQAQQQLDVKEIEERGARTFYKFVSESYLAFLLGNDERVVYCEDKFIECFERDTAIVAQKVEEITDWNAHLVASMEQLRNMTNELPLLDRKREEYCRDLEKFSDLINKLKEHKSSSEDKVQDKRSELQALEEELAGINSKLEEIRAIVASQEITVEDAKRLHSEKVHIMDVISKGSTAKHESNKVLWDLEMELSRECHELKSLTFQYNNTAANLVDRPGYRKKFIAETEVKIAATSDPRLLLGGVDINGDVLPYAFALKQSIMQQISDRKQHLMRLLDQEQVLEVSRTEVLDKRTIFETKKAKAEETLARENDVNEGALHIRLNEIETLGKKIATIRDPISHESEISRYQSRLGELEALHQKEKDEFNLKMEEVGTEISNAIQICGTFLHHVESKLKICEGNLTIQRAKLETIVDSCCDEAQFF